MNRLKTLSAIASALPITFVIGLTIIFVTVARTDLILAALYVSLMVVLLLIIHVRQKDHPPIISVICLVIVLIADVRTGLIGTALYAGLMLVHVLVTHARKKAHLPDPEISAQTLYTLKSLSGSRLGIAVCCHAFSTVSYAAGNAITLTGLTAVLLCAMHDAVIPRHSQTGELLATLLLTILTLILFLGLLVAKILTGYAP